MVHNDDNEPTTETIKYFIKKFSDIYLLPAISATLIALIYFAYKWGRTNLGYKPLTILNVLCIGDDTKRESASSDMLIDPNIAVNEIEPITISAASLSQLRNKSLSNKMLCVKKNTIFEKEIAKLYSNSIIRSQNICAYPIYEVLGEDSSNVLEPVWDYNDVFHPPRNFSSRKKNSSYKIKEGDFDYKFSNNDSLDSQKILNTDMCLYDINEKSSTNKNISEIFSRYKQKQAPFKEYYRLCYDCEDSNDDSYDSPVEIVETQVNSESSSEPILETSKSEYRNKPFNKSIFDESEFASVDLKSTYNKECSKKECSGIDIENDILKGEPFEDYWKIV